jgi:hypothetical protein
MGEKKGKSFLRKFVSVLSGKPGDSTNDSTERSSSFSPNQKEPFDLAFVKRFTDSGGKFLYCEKTEELYDYLAHISQETGLERVFCRDKNLQSILSKVGIQHFSDSHADADAFCSPCEYLISFNGGIMLTQNQTSGISYSQLPEIFIVIAKTSQIVENLRAGLSGIRTKYEGNLPGQITTLKGPKDSEIEQQPSATNVCRKDVYLILLEDQL